MVGTCVMPGKEKAWKERPERGRERRTPLLLLSASFASLGGGEDEGRNQLS